MESQIQSQMESSNSNSNSNSNSAMQYPVPVTLQRAWKVAINLIKLLLSLVVLDKIISYYIFFRYQSIKPYVFFNAEEFNTWKNTITPSILASNFLLLVLLQIIWRHGEELVSRVFRSVLKMKEKRTTFLY